MSRHFSAYKEQFINGTSAVYVEQMEEAWLKDPKSVHISWQKYFQNVYDGKITAYESPPCWSFRDNKKVFEVSPPDKDRATKNSKFQPSITSEFELQPSSQLELQVKHIALVLKYNYRRRGHVFADNDPLGLHFSPIQSEYANFKINIKYLVIIQFTSRDVT